MKRYTDADLAEILRRQGKPVDFSYRANPKRPQGPSESSEQQAVIRWWSVACKQYGLKEQILLAVPLQAARSPRNGARMKAEGARKGTPDLFLACQASNCGGLWIEMKTATGRVSPEQVVMISLLQERGYGVAVCRSSAEAIKSIANYLENRP